MFGQNKALSNDIISMNMYNTIKFNEFITAYSIFKYNLKLRSYLDKQRATKGSSISTEASITSTKPIPIKTKKIPQQVQAKIDISKQNTQQKQTGLLRSQQDTVDTRVNNAVLILQLSNGKIISVREKKSQKWMMPAGIIDQNESPFKAATREFDEETSFKLDKNSITYPVKYFDTGKTRIFYAKTSQQFGTYDKNNVKNHETDKLEYITMSEIKKYIRNNTYFRRDNIKSFTEMFYINFI